MDQLLTTGLIQKYIEAKKAGDNLKANQLAQSMSPESVKAANSALEQAAPAQAAKTFGVDPLLGGKAVNVQPGAKVPGSVNMNWRKTVIPAPGEKPTSPSFFLGGGTSGAAPQAITSAAAPAADSRGMFPGWKDSGGMLPGWKDSGGMFPGWKDSGGMFPAGLPTPAIPLISKVPALPASGTSPALPPPAGSGIVPSPMAAGLVGSTTTPMDSGSAFPEPGLPSSIGQQAAPAKADALSGPMQFLGDPKAKMSAGEALLTIAGHLMDAYGGSRKEAYLGIESPTRLQQEYKMKVASQGQANQIYAAMEAELQKITADRDAQIALAKESNAARAEAEIKVQKDTLLTQLALAEGTADAQAIANIKEKLGKLDAEKQLLTAQFNAQSVGDINTFFQTQTKALERIRAQALANASTATLGQAGLPGGGINLAAQALASPSKSGNQ